MQINDLKNRRLMIWGLGREGQDILRFLRRRQLDGNVIIYNDKETPISDEFGTYPSFCGGNVTELLNKVDVVIKSPGVSLYRPEIIEAEKRGILFTSSTDLCLSEIRLNQPRCKIIAITGSKGKSTSVSVLHYMMQAQGYDVGLGGNIGRPLIELVDEPHDFIVAEVSSYQAADLSVSPHIAMFTNMFFVHSAWHQSHENYCRDKLHLIAHQQPGDICFVNARNPELQKYIRDYPDKNIVNYDIPEAFHAEGKHLLFRDREILSINDLKICGDHNLDNLAGVFSIMEYLKMDIKQAARDLQNFEPLPHRLQKVAVKHGITFINDSISTAPEAAIGAMKSFDDDMVLISGGEENVQDYTEYASYIETHPKVRAVFALFQCGPRIAEAIRKHVTRSDFVLVEGGSLEDAVKSASEILKNQQGGLVLFSPTSPSFGVYKNFMERGKHFIDIVNKLDV